MTHPQRTDLLRALPRRGRGRSVVALVLVALLVVGALASLTAASPAAASRPAARRVVIVLATDVDWGRIATRDAPTLDYVLRRGTLANVVVKRQRGEATKISVPSQAALTLSAGTWTTPALGAQAALDASETVEGREASLAYESLYGRPAGGADVVYLGNAFAQRAQDEASLGARLGLLSASFEASGAGVASVGNSDWGASLARNLERPAGVGAANVDAVVVWGRVGESLLTSDEAAPYGIRTDEAAFDAAYNSASDKAAAASRGSLIVLDAGDTFRVSRARRSGEVEPEWTALATSNLEQAVALGVSGLTPNDLLMVISVPTDGSLALPQGFGTVLLYGRQFSPKVGSATSASTRRVGLVTLPDLSATAVDAAGIPLPAGFIGSPVERVAASGTLAQRLADLATVDRAARSALAVKYDVVTYYSAAIVILVAIALLASWVWRGRRVPRAASALFEMALLFMASVPLGMWLAFAFERLPQSSERVLSGMLWTTAGVWLVVLVVRLILRPRVALAVLMLATATLFAVDQWLGAPLSFSAPLGYSPIEAARFYGLGNEAAALMLSSALIGIGVLCDLIAGSRGRRLATWAVPVVGGVLVATAVAPMAGANLGVAVWGTFAVVVATRLICGGRLTWRVVVVALAAAAAVTLAAAWVDSLVSTQTHVGKAIASAGSGGGGMLWAMLVRKATLSSDLLTTTPWMLLFVAVYVWLSYGSFRPRGMFEWVSASDPFFMGAMRAILVTGVVAYFSEDSGVVMAVTLTTLLLLAFAYLVVVVRRSDAPAPARETATADTAVAQDPSGGSA